MRVLTWKRWRAADAPARAPAPLGRQATDAESLGRWLGDMHSEIETIHHELEWVASQLRESRAPTQQIWPRQQEEGVAKLGSEYWLG